MELRLVKHPKAMPKLIIQLYHDQLVMSAKLVRVGNVGQLA